MTPDELRRLAARYVWWQEPDLTLQDPPVLLRQILKIGTAEDYVLAREHWGEAAFRAALVSAPPGSIDRRSWEFWHHQYRIPLAPFPERSV